MRNLLISSAAALMCAAALPAVAAPANQDSSQSGAQSSRAAQQPRAADPNRRICVSDRLSDSRIRRRICRTQAEWDALQTNDDPSQIR
ncbi:MAG TPA: hypothetical protein VMG08_21385 [Allosphingosinicella sp.]|nr:hypothetical protein [Allosphingosinicella sp.]